MVCAVMYVLRTWVISLLALPSTIPVLTASCTDAEKVLRSGMAKFKCHSGSGVCASMLETLGACVSTTTVLGSSEVVSASLVLTEASSLLS